MSTSRLQELTDERDRLNQLMENDWLGLRGTRTYDNYRKRDRLNAEIERMRGQDEEAD